MCKPSCLECFTFHCKNQPAILRKEHQNEGYRGASTLTSSACLWSPHGLSISTNARHWVQSGMRCPQQHASRSGMASIHVVALLDTLDLSSIITWALLTRNSFLLFSQILGWCVIVTTALLSLLTTCCASCQSKVSHLQLMFWRVYAQKEKEQLEQIFQLYATKLSERNLKCFFENKEPEAIPLPDFQAWEDASQLHSFSSSKQHYSTIHRLVEEGHKEISEERETMLDFADRRDIP